MLIYTPLVGLLALATRTVAQVHEDPDYDCDSDITINTIYRADALARVCPQVTGHVTFNITDMDGSLVYSLRRANIVDINGRGLSVLFGENMATTMSIQELNIGPNVTKLALRDSIETLTITEMNIEAGEDGEDDACDVVTSTLEDSGMSYDSIDCTGKPDFVFNWGRDLEGAADDSDSADDADDDADDSEDNSGEEEEEEEDGGSGAMGMRTARVGVAVGVAALSYLAAMG